MGQRYSPAREGGSACGFMCATQRDRPWLRAWEAVQAVMQLLLPPHSVHTHVCHPCPCLHPSPSPSPSPTTPTPPACGCAGLQQLEALNKLARRNALPPAGAAQAGRRGWWWWVGGGGGA